MSDTFTEAFVRGNQVVHLVEDQWHYPILTSCGFVPETKEGVGFVRSYLYRHPDGRTVRCTTGANADYWVGFDEQRGYWTDLAGWCKKTEVAQNG